MPDVSIIIRTLNEQRYLAQLLSSVRGQQLDLSFEIILIDSGSSDSTLSIAEQFGCRIYHIARAEFSFGRSLNRACEFARGSYFVFISGHCIPCNCDWLQNLVNPLVKGLVQYCYGRQVGGPQTYWSESQIFDKYFPDRSALPQDGFYCNNANSAISADLWRRYRFDEELTGLEDMDLAKRLVADNGNVGYVSDAIVFHLHHENWLQVQRRFEREALALQQICPEVILRRRDIVRYFVRGVLSDVFSYYPESFLPNRFRLIVLYRFHQNLGSYKGNHLHKKASAQLRESYFYPKTSTTNRPVNSVKIK